MVVGIGRERTASFCYDVGGEWTLGSASSSAPSSSGEMLDAPDASLRE